VERFSPRDLPSDLDDGEFEVELASSGSVLTVRADQSVLSVLLDAGVDVDWSCGEGTCGTCETIVLSGIPEHRDSVLSDSERAENTTMFVCVSRAVTPRLLLDL
jgi:ferredoxin